MPVAQSRYPKEEIQLYEEDRPLEKLPNLRTLDADNLPERECRDILKLLYCPQNEKDQVHGWRLDAVKAELENLVAWYKDCPETPLGPPVIFTSQDVRRLHRPWCDLCDDWFPVVSKRPHFQGVDRNLMLHVKRNMLAVYWHLQCSTSHPEPFPFCHLFATVRARRKPPPPATEATSSSEAFLASLHLDRLDGSKSTSQPRDASESTNEASSGGQGGAAGAAAETQSNRANTQPSPH